MAGGFWKSSQGDLRGRMDFNFGGQNMMNRGYNNGMGSNAAALGILKGMANQRADMNHRNDRGQYQTGLDCYGTSRSFSGHFQGAANRSGMDPYNSINSNLVDSYRDNRSLNAFYMPRDSFMERLPQSGMNQYSLPDRNMFSGAHQFGSQSPQVSGKKRNGRESGRGVKGGQNQSSNKKGKTNHDPSMSNQNNKVKSISGITTDPKLGLDADVVNTLRCCVCYIESFSTIEEFKSHLNSSEHKELLEAAKQRNAVNLEYLRNEAKLAAKRNIIEWKSKGMNVQKVLNCPMCKCEYVGTYAVHKLTLEHDQICKFEQGKCCGKAFAGRDKLLEHETSLEHFIQKCKERSSPNFMDFDVPGNLKDLLEGNIYNIGLNNITPYEPYKPFGVQVLSMHDGYVCEICPGSEDFSLEEIKEHCTSVSHYEQVLKHLAEKSDKNDEVVNKELNSKLKIANQYVTENPTKLNDSRTENHAGNITVEDDDIHMHEGRDIDEDTLDFEYI